MTKDFSRNQNLVKRTRNINDNFNERKQKYQELKELRSMLKVRKAEVIKKQVQVRKQQEVNKQRKEENEMKSGNYQIIKNPEKIKKWKVKARNLIRKIPKDIFYGKYFKKDE